MDCYGLDQGLWEWNLDGPYATEIEGANGRKGIPLLSFFGWVVLVEVVVFLCQSLTQPQEVATGVRSDADKLRPERHGRRELL